MSSIHIHTDGWTMQFFQRVDFGLVNVSLDKAILFYLSVSHLASGRI